MVIFSIKKYMPYKGFWLVMDKSGFWYVQDDKGYSSPFSSLKKAKNNVNKRLGCKEVK